MIRKLFGTMWAKAAAVTVVGLLVFAGAAYAGGLPASVQGAVAKAANTVGVVLPQPEPDAVSDVNKEAGSVDESATADVNDQAGNIDEGNVADVNDQAGSVDESGTANANDQVGNADLGDVDNGDQADIQSVDQAGTDHVGTPDVKKARTGSASHSDVQGDAGKNGDANSQD